MDNDTHQQIPEGSESEPTPGEYLDNEITKMNFDDKLLELVELIKISDFVAIDCTVETTGFLLQDESFNPVHMCDTDKYVFFDYAISERLFSESELTT